MGVSAFLMLHIRYVHVIVFKYILLKKCFVILMSLDCVAMHICK